MRFFTTALTVFTSLAAIASAAPGASDKSVPAAVPSATGTPQLSSSTNPITCPLGDKVLKAGTKFEITWTPTHGSTITLNLRAGADSNNLDHITTITSSTSNTGSYTWSIPSSTEERSDYAIEIVAGDAANYSPRFEISKTGEHVEHKTSSKATSTSAKPTSTEAPEATATTESKSGTKTATVGKNATEATTTKEPVTGPTAPSNANSGAGKLGGSLMAAMVGIMGAVVLLN